MTSSTSYLVYHPRPSDRDAGSFSGSLRCLISKGARRLSVAFLGLVSAAFAQIPSRIPPDVILDYSFDAVHLMNGAGAPLYPADSRYAKWLARFQMFPPETLIVGKEAPLTHSVGPVVSFGGENQIFPSTPGSPASARRRVLAPDEVRQRIAAIEKFTGDVHAAGTRNVLSYICPITLFANSEKRSGFLEFYDQWEVYAREFHLGAKPQGNPTEDWVMRERDGSPSLRYPGNDPSYASLTRYSTCINQPGWRQWLKPVVQWVIRSGYDGVWVDNGLNHICFCTECQKLASNAGENLLTYRRDESLRKPASAWLTGYTNYFNELRSLGCKTVAVNYLEAPCQREVTDQVDLCMIEHCWLGLPRIAWMLGKHMGHWAGYYPHSAGDGSPGQHVQQNGWLVQLAYAMRGQRGTHWLYSSPLRTRDASFAHNVDSALLALAEGAALGGGVAVQVVGSGRSPFMDDHDLGGHQARQKFFTFMRHHRELYEGLVPGGEVALLVFPEQSVESLLEAESIHDALLWKGVLVDVLHGDSVTKEQLKSYRRVIVPGRPVLPPWMSSLPLVQGPDPIIREDWRVLTTALQKKQPIPVIRETSLRRDVLAQAAELQSLNLPPQSNVQGCVWKKEKRRVLHLLNYRTPVGVNHAGQVEALPDIPVSLRTADKQAVQSVMLFTLDDRSPIQLKFTQQEGKVSFSVPSLRVYSVVEIR